MPVHEQPGLAAIPLHYVDLLARHTTTLRVPVLSNAGDGRLDLRVPTLGAYAVNKAYTFSRRGTPGDASEAPKSAKDLLYLHDLMSAGPAVVEQIERDIAAVVRNSSADADQVRGAASHLGLAVKDGELGRHLENAVPMLMERDGAPDSRVALMELRGRLHDLHDILSAITDADDASVSSTAWDDEDDRQR